MTHRSVVEYYSEHDGYKCGYCKKPDSNYSHGMWAHIMTVRDYQDLIDRGWRRSGKYCYKPILDVICCPMYTIRCKALEFKPSKSQKKVLKRFNKFLTGQDDVSEDRTMSSSSEDMAVETEGREEFVENTKTPKDINVSQFKISYTNESTYKNIEEMSGSGTTSKESKNETTNVSKLNVNEKDETSNQISAANLEQNKNSSSVAGPDPTRAPCKKAKQARRDKRLEKLKKKGIDISSIDSNNKNKEKQIEDFLDELPSDLKRKLEIKLVRTSPASAEWLATSKETHSVYVKYQTIIHGDRPEKCTESQFNGFLVDSPLLEEYSQEGPPCGFGSFHQQYWLDGKLIAVGVIDILPKCVSSVYFFYDPDYMNLTLGTYGALREINFTRHLHTVCSELKYYYMGFYIHSCRKMRYKGNFHPSDLLCPETYKWFPLKDCIPKLEASPYSRFDSDIDGSDDNYPTKNDVDCIPVLSRGKVVPYKLYVQKSRRNNQSNEDIMEYAKLVGAKAVKSLIMIM